MDKIDFKKTYKAFYSPKPNKPEIVDMPKMQFAMVDGKGDPNTSQEFQDAAGALYSVVYGIKFGRKKTGVLPDFGIGPLEGLWWAEVGEPFVIGNKEDWLWTLMLWVPDEVSKNEFQNYVKIVKEKKPNPALNKIRLENFNEGKAVQIMHIGPYATENTSVDLMHDFAEELGYKPHGKHHEIYLSDPRRVAPEKNRTIVRHPVA